MGWTKMLLCDLSMLSGYMRKLHLHLRIEPQPQSLVIFAFGKPSSDDSHVHALFVAAWQDARYRLPQASLLTIRA